MWYPSSWLTKTLSWKHILICTIITLREVCLKIEADRGDARACCGGRVKAICWQLHEEYKKGTTFTKPADELW